MSMLLRVLLLVALAPTVAGAQAGDPQAGKTYWNGGAFCNHCHGLNGEGGFGPDLAGRQLSVAQFRQALRKPWGIMPAFTEPQVSDQDIANLVAYFTSLPTVAEPGAWRVPIPPGAPPRQAVLIAAVGCGQCHGDVLPIPRQAAGGINADWDWFSKMVYEHTTAMPEYRTLMGQATTGPMRMGNYSRTRLPETLLREIWQWASVDAGLRVPIRARLSQGPPASNGDGSVTYSLTLENTGLPGRGLTAETLEVQLALPAGATVANAAGDGYVGVRRDPKTGADVAVWRAQRMAPRDKQICSITLSGTGASAKMPGGKVTWAKPLLGDGTSDAVDIGFAPPAPPKS